MGKYEMKRATYCLFGLFLLVGWSGPSGHRPPEVTRQTPIKMTRFVSKLNNALRTLSTEPKSRRAISDAEIAMKKIATYLSAYFHGRNQNRDGVRGTYLHLRKLVHSLRGGEQPVLVFVHGIAHFHRRVHWQLALSYKQLGQTRQQIKHVRAILAADPKDAESRALLVRLETSKDP